ncbi:septum formation initiator [Pseudonocardia sp. CNS-139]|nr:septum formation initiator [Pseudonocardia sp. CNS-139]
MISDPELLDSVLRLAAAAGCELQRTVDPAEARPLWSRAPVVLLDPPAAMSCGHARLPRRADVIIAVRGDPDPVIWRQAVYVGAAHVVSLPEAEPWLVDTLTSAAEGVRAGGAVLGVVGGRGGAGASVFAAAVAVAAVREGERTLLVDCDPLGGGLDLVLGAEAISGLRWPDIDVGSGRVPARALHDALPAPPVSRDAGTGSLSVLSCDRSGHGPSPAAVMSVIDAGHRAGEVVVCDLPRYPTDAAVAAIGATDLVAVVVPADVRSCASAGRVAAVLAEHGALAGLVVRGPSPGGFDAGEVSRALGLPLLAEMRPQSGLAAALERGSDAFRLRGPLAGAARIVLDAVRGAAGPGVRP